MPLLVDGYNLMYAVRASAWGDERVGRAAICRLLGDWSAATQERVVVIFDGAAPPDALAAQIADPRIEVIYSAPRTADVVLADWLTAYSAPRRVLVVSSDREVRQAARRRQARIASSEEFASRLPGEMRTDAPASPAKPVLRAGEDRDAWLRQFGFDPQADEPFEHP